MAAGRAGALAWITLGLALAGCQQNGADSNTPTPSAPATKASNSETSSSNVTPVARRDEPTDLVLPEATREYIWELEHHGNLLGTYGFKPLGAALKQRQPDAIAKLLTTEFRGEIFADAEHLDNSGEQIVASRDVGKPGPPRPLQAQEFTQWLLDQTNGLKEIQGSQFGVKRIGPVKSGELDGPWQALVAFRLWGIRTDGGPAERAALLQIETIRPTQENLEAGAWFTACTILQSARSEASQSLFADQTTAWGMDPKGLHDNWEAQNKLPITGGVYASDFNRDGCVDILITDESPRFETLYLGRPEGGFRDATEEFGLRNPTALLRSSVCAAFIDLNGDGWEDLIYGDGVVLRNDNGRRFRDATGLSNFALTTRVSNPMFRQSICGIIPADFDRDGKLDLFITRVGTKPMSWLSETNERFLPNQLLRNLGNWRFEDVTQKMNMDGGGRSTFAAAWFDADNDNWPDLYIINEFGDGLLYRNREGQKFEQVDLTDSVSDFGSMGLAVGDIDNNGHIDAYVAAMYSKAGSRIIGNMPDDAYDPQVMRRIRSLVDGSELYRNEGGGKFKASGQVDQVHDVGWAWGPALADFNNDGFLDIYATAGYMSRDRGKPDG